jgi:hypothetical protein
LTCFADPATRSLSMTFSSCKSAKRPPLHRHFARIEYRYDRRRTLIEINQQKRVAGLRRRYSAHGKGARPPNRAMLFGKPCGSLRRAVFVCKPTQENRKSLAKSAAPSKQFNGLCLTVHLHFSCKTNASNYLIYIEKLSRLQPSRLPSSRRCTQCSLSSSSRVWLRPSSWEASLRENAYPVIRRHRRRCSAIDRHRRRLRRHDNRDVPRHV